MVQTCHYYNRSAFLLHHFWLFFQERIAQERQLTFIYEKICLAYSENVFSLVAHHTSSVMVVYRMVTLRLFLGIKNSLSI